MKKRLVIGAIVGLAAGAAAAATAFLATRVAGEIKNEMGEQIFTSPDGNNCVTVSCGTSDTARGLTYIRVVGSTASGEDECRLALFTRKLPWILDTEWTDNDHFKLLVGNGKRRQCCDVSFDGDRISAVYRLVKS